jgi:hypothetical protein
MMVALMSFLNYRWDKCHFLTIGGTNVAFLAIGGTYEGGTNVGRTNVGGRKVAASFRPFECNQNRDKLSN